LVAHASPESPTVPYAIEAKARPELGWDWGKGATNLQFQIHLENKALTLAGLMSPRVSERGSHLRTTASWRGVTRVKLSIRLASPTNT